MNHATQPTTEDVFPHYGRIGLALLLRDLILAALRRRR